MALANFYDKSFLSKDSSSVRALRPLNFTRLKCTSFGAFTLSAYKPSYQIFLSQNFDARFISYLTIRTLASLMVDSELSPSSK